MTARGAAGRARAGRWLFVVVLLLVAWALRLFRLAEVPPGWRDDELINMYALSGEVLSGSFPLYFAGASGHEPLFHYVQAGVQAVVGFNVMGGHLLPTALGLLSIACTYTLAARLFDRTLASISSLALAASFWSLMYSRIGLRHISVVPFALLSTLLLWRSHTERGRRTRTYVWLGIAVGASMYTYFASRLIPLVLLGFLLYLLVFHRQAFLREWRGIGLALMLALVIVAPMAVAIVRGGGADARIAELATPVRSLLAGDPGPLIDTARGTLGMFTTSGDPEWLYNLPGRPVFNVLGGVLLWTGVAACLIRWRRPDRFLVLWWFVVGVAPAFVSVPPASLGHTILAQPAAYILVAIAIREAGMLVTGIARRFGREPLQARRIALVLSALVTIAFVASNAVRDLGDYFISWPRESLVRFLYRADYRDVARYLDEHDSVVNVAVGSTLLGPWDRLALEADRRREDVQVRLFNPDRALVWVAGGSTALAAITDYPAPGSPFDLLLSAAGRQAQVGVSTFTFELPDDPDLMDLACGATGMPLALSAEFANGLVLERACWLTDPEGEGRAQLVTIWSVGHSLDLPPMPVVANPPPPGVYAGPRLAVFAHLNFDRDLPPAADDGLWVDPLTLRTGDRFAQVHRFEVDAAGLDRRAVLELGLYDPFTGERVAIVASPFPSPGDAIVVPFAGTGS